jgi:hypothetical protein
MLQTRWRFFWMLLFGLIIAFVIRSLVPLPEQFETDNPRNLFFSILQSFAITLAIWETTLWYDHWINKYIPWERSFSLRFLTVMAGAILICIAHFMWIGALFNAYVCPFPLIEDDQLFKVCLGIALNFSLMILFVEFGVQLFKKWKLSLVEIEKYKAETMQARLENIQQQVNPHFLFNNMSVLTSLIYKDQDKAADFVQQLSKVYRYLLDNSKSELVCLEDEMKFLDSYIYLLQIRYTPHLSIDKQIDSSQLKRLIPPFSVQLLLENAIKHNEISSEKQLHISLKIENEMLVVSNNRNERISEELSSKTGLKNIRSRYSFFTNRSVEVQETPDSFTVKIPLLQENESSNH